MALDTFNELWGRVLLRCPKAGPALARDWVKDAFREIAERRSWSWLVKRNQFLIPALYNTGTVTVTRNSATVTGAGTTFTGDMVGRQFRLGVGAPIYTISLFNSATSIDLDLPYGGATAATQTYEIFQAYVTPPSDFLSFLSVIDPSLNWRLHLNTHLEEIDAFDPQRSNSGQAYLLAARDYSSSATGTIGQPVQVVGSGPAPATSGIYSGLSDSLYTIEITTGGASGVADFKWKRDAGTYTTAVLTDENPFELERGILIYFPAATYVLANVFVIRVTALSAPGLPRYELWPHVKTQYVLPYCYVSRAVDLPDSGAVLPRYIRGDVVLELALAKAAQWPGPGIADVDRNPYYRLELSDRHLRQFEAMVGRLQVQDDEIYESSIAYSYDSMPWAPAPWLDANYLQKHAIL